MPGPRESDRAPARRSRPGRTAALLGATVVAVGAATALLVARGPGYAEGPRTVSVALAAERRGTGGSHWPTLEERASIASHLVGEAIDGRGGLVWLPNLGGVPEADVEITGTVEARTVGHSLDSLTLTLFIPDGERTDTIRQTIFAAPPDHAGTVEPYVALADRALASLGGRRSDAGVAVPPTRRTSSAGCCAWGHFVEWHGEQRNPRVIERLLDERADLAIVERALLDAVAVRDLPARLDSLEAMAARFPTYYPALWTYADALTHYGALAGRSADEAVAALDAVLAVRPKGGLAGLRTHLVDLTAVTEGPARPAPSAASDASRLAARGAWEEARAASARDVDGSAAGALRGYRLAAIGHWLGGLAAGATSALRASLAVGAPEAGRVIELTASQAAELAWLDGLVASVAGDGPAMDAARLRIRESGAPLATDLERSLRALQLATAEDEEMRAARLLRSLEEERASRLAFGTVEDDAHPFLTGVNRLAAAQWFIKHGRSSYAIPLLGWWERLPVGAPATAEADAVLSPLDLLQRARAYREAGDPSAAFRHFSGFLRAFDMASPRLGGWVRDAEAARDSLARVRGASG